MFVPCDRARDVDRWSRRRAAFTLLEVIVACTIFFLVAFAVLELVTRGLGMAKSLQQREPDAGMLAAVYMQTNILVEEMASGDFEDLYPELYPGFTWERATTEVGSNGLFQVDYAVYHGQKSRRGASETRMSILLFKPGSPPGSASRSFGN